MNETTIELLKIRVVAFLYEAGSMLVTTLFGVLLSESFRQLVVQHWGEGLITSVILLTIAGVAKHLRNKKILSEVQLGSRSEHDAFLI